MGCSILTFSGTPPHGQRFSWPLALGLGLLTACTSGPSTPPSVSLSSPAVGQTVSGTVSVQINAKADSGILKVGVYARGKGTSGDGVLVGSASSEPFVVSWFTPGFPNTADLELYARAESNNGSFSNSDPVAVKTSNSGAPTFSYLIGYTLPVQPSAAVQGQRSQVVGRLPGTSNPLEVRPPAGWFKSNPSSPRLSSSSLAPQAASARSFVLRYGWNAVPAASGYRVWQSSSDIAGPYSNAVNQLAVGSGIQEYTPTLQGSKPGDTYWGAVTAVVNGSEGGYSNASQTVLLPYQGTSAPAANSTVSNKPTLSWSPTSGVQGYLWYVSAKTQSAATASDWLCTNYPNSTDQLTSAYPASCAALAPGSYYWWVAGVSFNAQGVVQAYTFSDPVQFSVP